MQKGDVSNSGLRCYLCKYWFCKMYLLKQHNRKCHKELGELIDVPAIPVKHLYPDSYMLFALFHVDDGPPVLMRMFETVTQSTMRVANKYDFEELKNTRKETDNGPNYAVVYDVYLQASDINNRNLIVIWRKCSSGPQKAHMQHEAFNEIGRQHKFHIGSMMGGKNVFLQNLENPYCVLFEKICNAL